jgi:hypothetical protein
MTFLEKGRKIIWKGPVLSKSLLPTICDWDEARIKRRSELAHDAGERIIEVLVLTASKAVTSHDDSTAEGLVLSILLG